MSTSIARIITSVWYFSSKYYTADDVHAEAERLTAAPKMRRTTCLVFILSGLITSLQVNFTQT